jgi:hypothetical protein
MVSKHSIIVSIWLTIMSWIEALAIAMIIGLTLQNVAILVLLITLNIFGVPLFFVFTNLPLWVVYVVIIIWLTHLTVVYKEVE